MNLFNSQNIEIIRQYLLKNNETIAVAESATSGLLQLALGNATNASEFYQGGITTYNIGQKCRHLLINPIKAESCNCVSENIAGEMALNVCHLFKSDWGLSSTGYTSPVPESDNKLFLFWAVTYKNEIVLQKKIEAKEGDPLKVQLFYINHLLDNFASYLQSKNS